MFHLVRTLLALALALLGLLGGSVASAQTMIQRTGMMKSALIPYPAVAGYAAPVYGTGGAGTYPPTGWTGIQNASVDDNFLTIALPFTFYMAGTGYTTTYLGSNSYITFGGGSSTYGGLSASTPAYPKLMFGASDNSYQRVSTLSSATSLKIRYEGNGTTSGIIGTPGIVVELTLFNPALFLGNLNVIEMRVGVHNRLAGVSMIANASTALLNYTLAQNQSYVFIGNATGSNWRVASGAHVDLTLLAWPTLTTTAVTGATGTAATSGGTITSQGGAAVTASGICWSTSPNPTTADSKTTGVTATGAFAGALTGLTAGIPYYVRAYATNAAGTSYGDQQGVVAYTYTGAAKTFTVPTGVTQLQVETWGAQGGDVGTTLGGRGGYAKATVAVTPGETAYAYVGQQGSLSAATTNTAGVATFNGGGAGAIRAALGTTASGGGASDVRLGGSGLANRIVVAGGGGGCDDYNSSAGGAGGGSTGASGATVASSTAVGTGGSQSAGGTGGAGGSGALGLGGSATQALFLALDTRLSGGGGGYYGGGLGSNSGGGGGSGYTGGVSLYTTSNATMSSGLRTGNGFLVLSYTVMTNWLRGAPTSDATNRRAFVTSMAGINSSVPYRTDLEAWTGVWQNPQAIYEHAGNLDDPTTWYQTSANEGSTWSNPTPGTSAGELVVDMQAVRTLARFAVFQMFADGKATHAYFYSHASTSATPPGNTDGGWVLQGGGVIGAGATNGTTTVTSPTPFTMTPFISRYIKIRAQNDGSLGSSGYIELKGVKAFWQ